MSRTLFTPRHRARSAPVPPLPHPSWRAGDAALAHQGATLDAREFWQRLGL